MGKIRFLVFLGGAFAAWGLWLAEVLWFKGWGGLAWLSGFNWSAVPICAWIVIVAGYLVTERAKWSDRIVFFGIGCIITLAAFAFARWAVFQLFSAGVPGRPELGAVLVLLIAGLLVSVGLTISANRWLVPLHYWTIALVLAALLLVIPLSFATIKVFPAINGSTDEIHSIKMGYPVFWTATLVPLALRLGRKPVRG